MKTPLYFTAFSFDDIIMLNLVLLAAQDLLSKLRIDEKEQFVLILLKSSEDDPFASFRRRKQNITSISCVNTILQQQLCHLRRKNKRNPWNVITIIHRYTRAYRSCLDKSFAFFFLHVQEDNNCVIVR